MVTSFIKSHPRRAAALQLSDISLINIHSIKFFYVYVYLFIYGWKWAKSWLRQKWQLHQRGLSLLVIVDRAQWNIVETSAAESHVLVTENLQFVCSCSKCRCPLSDPLWSHIAHTIDLKATVARRWSRTRT